MFRIDSVEACTIKRAHLYKISNARFNEQSHTTGNGCPKLSVKSQFSFGQHRTLNPVAVFFSGVTSFVLLNAIKNHFQDDNTAKNND